MKSAIRTLLATAAVVLMAQGAFAALSQEYVDFGKGPAQYFMTREELAKWKTINNDADAKAFIDLFWLRHDPSPGTPANEFKDAVDQRVKFADQTFGTRRIKGSMTDRGHVYVVLGAPTEPVKQERLAASDQDQPTTDTSAIGNINAPRPAGVRQTWTYDPAKAPSPIVKNAIGPSVQTFVFVDPNASGDFRFDRIRSAPDYNALLDKSAEAYLAQPNVTSLTQTTTTKTTTTTTVTKTAVSTIKTPALQAAIDEAKGGKSALDKGASVAYEELLSPAGEYYVPISFYLPKSAGFAADAADTFFGVVSDSNGAQVFAFEEPATLTESKGDLFVDKTLNFPATAGKYTVTAGLAKAGSPVALASRTIELNPIAKEAVGTSRLILSNNVYEMTTAAPVKAPFAFGKLKIVPKANLIFGNKDELTYFVELHNPGVDPTTNMPKLQAKLELTGAKLARPIVAPLTDVAALPLTGAPGPGQYAVISSIPLGEMSKPLDAGDYTLKMKLIDTVTKQTYTLEQAFKIGS